MDHLQLAEAADFSWDVLSKGEVKSTSITLSDVAFSNDQLEASNVAFNFMEPAHAKLLQWAYNWTRFCVTDLTIFDWS